MILFYKNTHTRERNIVGKSIKYFSWRDIEVNGHQTRLWVTVTITKRGSKYFSSEKECSGGNVGSLEGNRRGGGLYVTPLVCMVLTPPTKLPCVGYFLFFFLPIDVKNFFSNYIM